MPFEKDLDQRTALSRSIGLPDLDVENDVEFKETLRAAYRTENTIGSFIARESGLPNDVVNNESFNPFDHFTEEEKLDPVFVGTAALADTVAEIDAVRRQQQRERSDRKLLAESGADGFGATLIAAGVDPVNYIPVGNTVYNTYRKGESILKSAYVTAGVAAGATAAAEAGLHLTQMERTFGESAVNVGAATLFGGTIGAAPPALKKLMSDYPNIQKEIDDSMNPEPTVARGEDSVGAQRVFDDAIVKGKVSRQLAKLLAFDPLSRTVTSSSPETRALAAQLAESPIAFERGIGTAVETLAKIHDGKYYEALTGHLESFKAFRKDGGAMNRRQFGEAVAKEVRNPASSDPHIKRAAQEWRSKLYDPLKDEFVANKLLPEDVGVETAVNYLNRVWNKQKIAANLDQFVKVVSRWLQEEQGVRLADQDIDADELAREIASRIRSTPDGRLPYDYKIGENSAKAGGAGSALKGPLRKRSFNIPDKQVEEFLDNDIENLGGRYLRQTATDLELTRRFGDVNMTREIKAIDEAWSKRIEKAKDSKERLKLERLKNRDINDIAAMRDRMRGTFGQVDPDNYWVRTGRTVRDLNYLRFMGGVTASSLPDAARIVMAEGIVDTFRFGLAPMVRNMKAFKMAGAEAKRYGVGIDALMGGRSEIIADVADYSQGGTALERGVRAAANKFGQINLMDQWTGGVKQLHAVVMQNKIVGDMLKGKYDKRLGQLGISEADSKNIAQQLKKYAEKIDGVWVANTRQWDNQDLASMYGGALRKESDRVIVMPGQEKPLFMSTELGKTFFQFRSFMFSATQRMLIAGIQGQDAHFMQGVLGITTLGMMAYAFKQWDAGREISDDPAVWVTEGIDRSGVLGILMEMNNTIEKTSQNNFGLRPLLGIEVPASRFASRSQAEALLGPTFGSFLETTLRVAGAASNDEEWKESDTRALRRLLPYQNLLIFRQGLDKMEELTQ